MAKFEGDKTFIANMCISKPKIVASIISEWIENDEEQGVSKAIKSLISVDDQLLNILKPYISSNTFESIKSALEQISIFPGGPFCFFFSKSHFGVQN